MHEIVPLKNPELKKIVNCVKKLNYAIELKTT